MRRTHPTAGAALCAITLAVAACGDGAPSEPAPGASLRLEVVGVAEGEGQAGAPLGAPLRVRVTDEAGRGIPGVGIDWRAVELPWLAAAQQSRIAPASRVTGADGGAAAAWTLGTSVGLNLVVARVVGDTAEVRFKFWGVAGPAAAVHVFPDAPITVEVGAVFRLGARGRDAFGNDVDKRAAWRSTDPAVVGVGADGTARALAPGTADLVATIDAASAAVRVSVVAGG